jgi:hypothetical protein
LKFNAFKKWLAKITNVDVLAKIWLNFEELTRNAPIIRALTIAYVYIYGK